MVRRAYHGLRRRPVLAGALIYAVVCLVFLGPALLPGKTLSNSDLDQFKPPWVAGKPSSLTVPSNPELGDAPEQLQLFLHAAARRFPDVQQWTPNIMGGRPFEADSQSAIFSPYSAPAYVLPFLTALGWIGVLKLWVAAFGMFLLGRALGMRFGGALLAGLVYALNLKMVTWISYPHMSVWTLIPWLLLATEMLVRRPDLLAGGLLAGVVGIQFLCGHAESSFHALLTTVLFFALRLWQARRGAPPGELRPGRTAAVFAGALVAGTALSALTLVPFVQLLLHSADFHERQGQSVDVSLQFKESIGIFLPDFWGRSTQTPIRLFVLERALYVGALPMMLAFAALVLRPKLERIWVAIFGAVWFCVVLGIPPILQIITRLPIFSSGHNTRLIALTMVAVSLLAGWGFDDVTERVGAPGRRKAVLLFGAGLFVVPFVIIAADGHVGFHSAWDGLKVAWGFVHPPGRFLDPIGVGVIRASALWIWIVVAGAAIALLVARHRGRIGPSLFIGLSLALVCLDLFRIGMGFNPAISQKSAKLPETPAIRYLQAKGTDRVAAQESIPQNILGFDFGLYESRGYDLPILRRYDHFWRTQVEPEAPTAVRGLFVPLGFYNATPKALHALRLLGTRYVLWPTSTLALTPPLDRLLPFAPLKQPGATQVYHGRDARIYRLDRALPRAWVAPAQHLVDGGTAAFDEFTSPTFDARRAAITEHHVAGVPDQTSGGAPAAASTARITHYADEKVTIRTNAAHAGLLVLGDSYYPGWKATVDDHPVTIQRADYLFRGVPVRAGVHTVEFRYEPETWTVGWITSLIAFVGILLAVGLGWRRRRSRAAPAAS